MALHAEGGEHGATAAAPEPGAATRLTAHAWPAAGVLPTWAQRETPAGLCREQQRAGGAALRSHGEGEGAEGWGWCQLGMGSE